MNSVKTDTLNIQLDPVLDNYAVMGNPVAHSKSPQIHLAFAKQTNQKINYQSILVPAGKFTTAIQLFMEQGGKGLNITLPYKYDAFNLANNLTTRASDAKAVNFLSFKHKGIIEGDNTDGIGLVRDLKRNRFQINRKRVLIIGAGGAVRGVLGPLLDQNPESITIANRTVAKAESLVDEHDAASNLVAHGLTALGELGSFDVVINGTSSGLTGELPALPVSIIDKNSCCYDMVYGDSEPIFIQWCKSLGARIALDGLGMLVEQAAESYFIWRGIRPETDTVIAMLRDS